MPRITINRFDAGRQTSKRASAFNGASHVENFNIFRDPYRLMPNRDLETKTAGPFAQDFLWSAFTEKLYALCNFASAGTGIAIVETTTPLNPNFTASTSATDEDDAKRPGTFMEWDEYLYFFVANGVSPTQANRIGRYKFQGGSEALTATWQSLSASTPTTAQGLVAQDDNLYLPHANFLARVTPAHAYTEKALTLNSRDGIRSIDNWRKYMIIGTAPKEPEDFNNSAVYVWDLVSDDVMERWEVGKGTLRIVANVEGTIVVVMDEYMGLDSGVEEPALAIKVLQGSEFVTVRRIVASRGNSQNPPGGDLDNPIKQYSEVVNGRLYFLAKVPYNATDSYIGMWCFGKGADGQWGLSLDTVVAGTDVDGLGAYGNEWFIHYTGGDQTTGNPNVKKVNQTASYTATSAWESLINPGMSVSDKPELKSLSFMRVNFQPLPSGASVILEYKKDNATAWTAVATEATDGAIFKKMTKAQSAEFGKFRDIEFRVESVGGAVITSIDYEYQVEEL